MCKCAMPPIFHFRLYPRAVKQETTNPHKQYEFYQNAFKKCPSTLEGMQKRKKKRGENTMLLTRWTEAVSLCILIGLSRCIPQLGYNSPHLITHYDNIITDVQANKENSWRTVCNVSNWSHFSLALYSPFLFSFSLSTSFSSMLLCYRLHPQLGLASIWYTSLLATWLHCWWSAAVAQQGTCWRNCATLRSK